MSEASCKILLVDDSPEMRDVLRAMLQIEGHEVTTATNGAEALALLRSGVAPEVIILDLTMPVMSGWEFRLEQLGDPALREIPAIIYSAISSMRPESLKPLRAVAVVEKGSGLYSVLGAVDEICRNRDTCR